MAYSATAANTSRTALQPACPGAAVKPLQCFRSAFRRGGRATSGMAPPPATAVSIARNHRGVRGSRFHLQRMHASRDPSFESFGSLPNDSLRASSSPSSGPIANKSMGVYWILLLNFLLFGLAKFGGQMWISNLYLNSAHPQWWQFITCTFCHFDWAHLSQNAFFLLVFGKLVEEEEGWFGLWASYLLCGVGGALASHLLGGGYGYSLGASGAVFGLFTISVLLKLQLSVWKILEFVILGQFVFTQVMTEVANQAAVKGGKAIAGSVSISHVAHLGGALMGVVLVLILSRLPEAK